jgi:Asp-tRNA(Asn)/Glu-tRNA(Gln) amidotransferase B subunit
MRFSGLKPGMFLIDTSKQLSWAFVKKIDHTMAYFDHIYMEAGTIRLDRNIQVSAKAWFEFKLEKLVEYKPNLYVIFHTIFEESIW